MDQKPFVRLTAPRPVETPALPADLVGFYTGNEGVGLESSPERIIRLCRLDEVRQVGWHDLHTFGSEVEPGWENFSAYRLGVSSFFDDVLYVLAAPSCPPGSILTIGADVAGPGGTGPAAFEPSLVLASSLAEWLKHLEDCHWIEFGLIPGSLAEIPEADRQKHRGYYKALNPGLTW